MSKVERLEAELAYEKAAEAFRKAKESGKDYDKTKASMREARAALRAFATEAGPGDAVAKAGTVKTKGGVQ